MGMTAKALPGSNSIIVQDAKQSEPHSPGIVIAGKAEAIPGIEPSAMAGMTSGQSRKKFFFHDFEKSGSVKCLGQIYFPIFEIHFHVLLQGCRKGHSNISGFRKW